MDVKFQPATNDRWINKHIPTHVKSYKSNQDSSPVTSGVAIVRYLNKYIVKVEPKSDALKMINSHVLEKMNKDDTLRN